MMEDNDLDRFDHTLTIPLQLAQGYNQQTNDPSFLLHFQTEAGVGPVFPATSKPFT